MKIAAIQMAIALGDTDKNYAAAERLIQQAAGDGADTVVLSELWNTSFYPNNVWELADDNGQRTTSVLCQLAKDNNINVVGGSVANRHDGGLYNTTFIVNRQGQIVATYDKANEAVAYRNAMIFIAILASGATLACFFGTKERHKPIKEAQDKKDSLFAQIKLIISTKTLRSFYIFFALTQMAFTFKGSSAIYYAKYYLQQNESYLTCLLSAFSIAGIIAPMVAMYMIRRGWFTKLGMLKTATLGAGITALPIAFIPAEYALASSAFLVISTFFGELGIIVYWAMPADCADFCELRFNKKMVGVLGAVALFSQKFAMSLVGVGIGAILSYVGYQANGNVTPEVSSGILIIISILPVACHFVSYYFLKQYDLDEQSVENIHLELAELYNQAR